MLPMWTGKNPLTLVLVRIAGDSSEKNHGERVLGEDGAYGTHVGDAISTFRVVSPAGPMGAGTTDSPGRLGWGPFALIM